MGKVKKFFLSPHLYWRDFLLKKYPVSPPHKKSTLDSIKDRPFCLPDFYFPFSHATGRSSFMQSMHIIGVQIVNLHRINAKSRQKQMERCFELITESKKNYAYVGVASDRVEAYPDFGLFSHKKPIYTIVRDPIVIIKSFLNHLISKNILMYHNGECNNLYNSTEYNVSFIKNSIRKYDHLLKFTSRMKIIKNSNDIKIIDTSDLSDKNIVDTITSISMNFDSIASREFNRSTYIDREKILSRTFTPSNRMFRSPNIKIDSDNYSILLRSIVVNEFDRTPQRSLNNMDDNSKKISIQTEDNKQITCEIVSVVKKIPDSNISIESEIEKNIQQISDYVIFCIDRYKKMSAMHKKYVISEHYVIDKIVSSPELLDDFNRLMDRELQIVEKLRPSVIDTWTYLKQIRK